MNASDANPFPSTSKYPPKSSELSALDQRQAASLSSITSTETQLQGLILDAAGLCNAIMLQKGKIALHNHDHNEVVCELSKMRGDLMTVKNENEKIKERTCELQLEERIVMRDVAKLALLNRGLQRD